MKLKFILLLLIMLAALARIPAQSGAYYNDSGDAGGGRFGAGAWHSESDTKPIVLITEVFFSVDPKHGNNGDFANPDEWVEIFNAGAEAVDLQNWSVSDDSETDLVSESSRLLAAGQYAVIAKSADTWKFWNVPRETLRIQTGRKIGDGLSDSGDRLLLKDQDGNIVDACSWGNDYTVFDPPFRQVPEGFSMARVLPDRDSDSAEDFFENIDPSPGYGPLYDDNIIEPLLAFQHDRGRKAAAFTVSGIDTRWFSELDYKLTYISEEGAQELNGSTMINGFQELTVDSLVLASCTVDGCSYHTNPRKFFLTVTLGGKTNKTAVYHDPLP